MVRRKIRESLNLLRIAFFAIVVCAMLSTNNAYPSIDSAADSAESENSTYSGLPLVRWTTESIQRGDNLSRVFKRAGFNVAYAYKLAKMKQAKLMHVIAPGDQVRFAHGPGGKLIGLEFFRSQSKTVSFVISDGEFELVPKSSSLSVVLEKKFESDNADGNEAAQYEIPEIDETRLSWVSVEVRSGDSLTRIFKRAGLPTVTAIEIADSKNGEWLAKLKVGQEIRIGTFPDGEFAVLESHTSPLTVGVLLAGEDYYFYLEKVLEPEMQQHEGCGVIKTSLYGSGLNQGFGLSALNAYVEVFETRIDFSRELRKGDEFCMIYEQGYLNYGNPVGEPIILAAFYRQDNRIVHAFRFEEPVKGISYYDKNGDNLRGHFLRSPLKYGRVTSNFSKRRFHPVLKKWRPHKGVDYGAPTGTPIMVTANGVVSERKRGKAYGNVLFIRHGSKYTTVYAHLNAFAKGIRVGTAVEQGQIIGYVGKTGLATGPHLHYEFRVNGVHHDPLKYPMPKGDSVLEDHLERFKDDTTSWLAGLEAINKEEPMVAYTPATDLTESE